jgi:hypothetical protein
VKQRQLLTRSETGGTDKRASIGSIYTLVLNLTAPEKKGRIDPENKTIYITTQQGDAHFNDTNLRQSGTDQPYCILP